MTDRRFRLTEAQATELAAQFGTPLYVLDESTIIANAKRYQDALKREWPNCDVSYASKANSTLAVVKVAYEAGLTIDVASEGELRAAIKAGVPPEKCHLHGNNKSDAELRLGMELGIETIVIDHHDEIERIAKLREEIQSETQYLLRIAPGVRPNTHSHITTGSVDTKFGFSLLKGIAEAAILRCIELKIPVVGIHCHVGSQLAEGDSQCEAAKNLGAFLVRMRDAHDVHLPVLNLGGGLGVQYLDSDDIEPVEDFCERLAISAEWALGGSKDTHKLCVEPGRGIIGEAGVTLYTVGAIKSVPITDLIYKNYVAVDGGLSDNIRPALYSAAYDVRSFRKGPTQRTTVSGKHCETDTLFPDVLLPIDLQPGDLLQVLTTGAYNSSMANNYNRYPRPATVMIRQNGTYELVVKRETWDQLFEREVI
ncbi:MAG TPA: diaminopimelate decarboxylase [Fimbriimonas sp.]|nr:diaminopimelate decarboxylase [Fimbriimonas sp.]